MASTSTGKMEYMIWNPSLMLTEGFSMAFVILNQPIEGGMKSFLKRSWSNAALKIAVDGGLNELKKIQDAENPLIPDVICGDFDSVSADVLAQYEIKGSEIVATPDQNETDFTKAIRQCIKKLNERSLKVDAIVAFARSGGRFDHILGNLNTLYIGENISDIPLYLAGENCLTWLLKKGKHKIIFNKQMESSHLGLIPVGHPCLAVTTTGLQWNVDNARLEFGSLVSSSNKFTGSDVTVESDQSLLWTMEFNFY